MNSVTFDNEEALVAAGSASGAIKLWDLEEAKSKLANYKHSPMTFPKCNSLL